MVSPSTPDGPTDRPVPGGSVPGVVAAVIAGPSSPDLPVVLAALAAQDYPAVQVVVLVTTDDETTIDQHRSLAAEVLPAAHVRGVGDIGFARAADQILHVVEGDGGLFLLLDDRVALAPDAVRQLVEEMYRSNAGILGPKLVDWDQPSLLVSVGFDVDPFGERDDGLEPYELDQEQHDATGDKFALSAACIVVRADLFRRLGGFERSLDDDVAALDLCWRAHIAGARVVVVPSAVARRRNSHRTGTDHLSEAEAERQRLTTVAALTGGLRLALIVPALVVLAVGTGVVAVVRGRPRVGLARLIAPVSLLTGFGRVVVRRRRIAALRTVPDREVAGLQVRGSVRWNRFRRERFRRADRRAVSVERDRSPLTIAVWSVLLVLLVIGGRRVITEGVQPIGEFLPFPESPLDTIRSYLSGWWDRGLGETTAQPTGSLLVGVLGLAFFAQMGLLQTVGVLGSLLLGWWGVRRLVPGRAGLVAMVVYAAVPLPYAAIAAGRMAVLVAYATLPWAVLFARRVADESRQASERRPLLGHRVANVARLTLVVAVAAAFSPAAALVTLAAVVVIAVAGAVGGDSVQRTVVTSAATLVAFTGVFVLHLPWSLRFLDTDGWAAIVGRPERLAGDRGLWSLMRFDIGPSALSGLVIVVYASVIIGLFVARSTRLVGAMCSVSVGSVFLLAAVSSDAGNSFLPEVGVLLAPVGFALALGAGTLFASFEFDVRGGSFGLRQPLAVIGLVAIVIGVVPVAAVAVDGRWEQPSSTLVAQLDELLVDPNVDGDYRVLVIGDPELVPGADRFFADGIAYSIVSAGRFGLGETWSARGAVEERVIGEVLTSMADRATARAGRLVAPLGIRYVVVPVFDRVRSTADSPRPLPVGLLDALGEQLDLKKVYSPASMAVFENQQWIPVTALLGADLADASRQGGAASLARVEFDDARAVLTGTRAWSTTSESLRSGLVHLGVPFDDRWSLEVGGRRIAGDGSFGSVMSFSVPSDASGSASLLYQRPLGHLSLILMQVVLWVGVLAVVRSRRPRRRDHVVDPIIRLDATEVTS